MVAEGKDRGKNPTPADTKGAACYLPHCPTTTATRRPFHSPFLRRRCLCPAPRGTNFLPVLWVFRVRVVGDGGEGAAKAALPVFLFPNGHGLHPCFVVAKIWADRVSGEG